MHSYRDALVAIPEDDVLDRWFFIVMAFDGYLSLLEGTLLKMAIYSECSHQKL